VPIHTTAVVTNWMAARRFRIIEHPPYSLDLAPADFFLFSSMKRELAGKTLTQETLKKEWEGAVITLSAVDFATSFRHWYKRCEKTSLADTSRKAKNTKCPNYNHFLFIGVVRVLSKQTSYL
jgi:hypothetical protein